jgi:RNA polymerase sigma-70 factor (ECF subfamily)
VDVELVERARAGDVEAFEAMAVAMADRLMGVAFGILRDRDLAEDAVQSTMIVAWRDLPRLREADRFEGWVHRILVRSCRSAYRQSRRRWVAVQRIPMDPVTPDPLGGLIDRDTLERAFRHLPIDQRVVLVYRFFLDLPVDRIADALGIPAGTVKSRLHYAIAAMRAAIDADTRGILDAEVSA